MADQYRSRDDYRSRHPEDDHRARDSRGGGIFGPGGLLGSGRDRDRDGTDDRLDADTRRQGERLFDRAYQADDRRPGTDRGEDRYANRDGERGVAIDETSRVISSDKVHGTRVYNFKGDRLGTIRNLMIDKRKGRVEYAVLSFGGFLGMGERYHPIPWEVLKYDERQDGYVINMDERQLERGPSFGGGQEPRWDYGYSRHVHDYYGVPF